MIHYVGGDEDEDEWIRKNSDRLRPAQTVKPSPAKISSEVKVGKPTVEQKLDSRNYEKGVQHANICDDRPKRKSSVSADDARLALALQEQELRASRARQGASAAQKRPPATARAWKEPGFLDDKPAPPDPHQATLQPKKPKRKVPDPSQPKSVALYVMLDANKAAQGLSETASQRQKLSKIEGTKSGDRGSDSQGKDRTHRSVKKVSGAHCHGEEVHGRCSVAVRVVPDESASADSTVPALQRSRLSMSEDATVLHLKRRIVEEACPGMSATELDIRAPSGMLLGQDHSLKFVRTVLWPASKGELVLRYSRHAKSLF